jgi:hypothetical protein
VLSGPYSPLWFVFLENSGEFKEIVTIKNQEPVALVDFLHIHAKNPD